MSEKKKVDKRRVDPLRKSPVILRNASKFDDRSDDMAKWQEACNKVFQNSQFNIESLNRLSDVPQVDQQARVYRRASIDNYPLRAKANSRLTLFSLEEVKKVGTQKQLETEESFLPKRYNTVSEGLSEYSFYNQETFPRIHSVMSKRFHRKGSTGEHLSIPQHESVLKASKPPLPSSCFKPVPDAGYKQDVTKPEVGNNVPKSSVPGKSRKLSIKTGMPTIKDEDIETEDEDPVESPRIFLSLDGEANPQLKFCKSRRGSQRSSFSDQVTEDEEETGSKVRFGQPETETEAEEPDIDGQRWTKCESRGHRWTKPTKRKRHIKKGLHSHPRRGSKESQESKSAKVNPETIFHIHMESDEDLENRDIEAIASHRTDSRSGFPIHKISRISSPTPASFSTLSHARQMLGDREQVVDFGGVPHDLFVEMDELNGSEWQEQARWIKFEENLLEGAERWSKAHIASLSFHSVINLRQVLEQCVLLLDIDVHNFHDVVYRLVEEFAIQDDLSPETKSQVLKTLLFPHKYVDGHSNNLKVEDRKRTFSRASLRGSMKTITETMLSYDRKKGSSANIIPEKDEEFVTEQQDSTQDEQGKSSLQGSNSFNDLYKAATAQRRDNIMNRLVLGTEGTMTLVGALESIDKPLVGLVRLTKAVVMPNLMEIPLPVRFIFVLFTPKPSYNLDCHEIGRAFSTLMSNKTFQQVCYTIEEREELLNSINNFLDETVVLPPGDWDKKHLLSMTEIRQLKNKKRLRLLAEEEMRTDRQEEERKREKEKDVGKEVTDEPWDPLTWTSVPFGGVINEFKQRVPHLKSDITDAFNPMCLGAIVFIFCSVLSGAVAFGGLLDGKTGGLIGIPETLISSSICGCIFALLSGQPLVIIGVTGPVLVYDEALYKFTKDSGVEFLPCRFWISVWSVIIAIVVAGFQGSVVVKFFTKFTKDIFAGFVATVFIYEALLQTVGFFLDHPPRSLIDYCLKPDIFSILQNSTKNDTYEKNENTLNQVDKVFDDEPNSALFSFMLQFFTFWIAYYLKIFRNGKALGRTIRRALGDFGLPISIVTMVLVDKAFPMVHTEKLKVPDGLVVTKSDQRDWFIPPLGENGNLSFWIPLICFIPAVLLYVLLFINATICELIIMERCKKSSGLHWDIVLLCILNVPSTLFGGPWMCVAQVRAVTHLSALTVMSTNHAPGESAKIIKVKDQRVTGFCVSLLVGLSILLSSWLRLIPASVIFGVFLYLGIASLSGIDFFDRVWLMFMPQKHHPNVSYVRHVRTMKMHLFTLSQVLGLAILWVVKYTSAALSFPFFVIFMVPLRLSLKWIFTPKELEAMVPILAVQLKETTMNQIFMHKQTRAVNNC